MKFTDFERIVKRIDYKPGFNLNIDYALEHRGAARLWLQMDVECAYKRDGTKASVQSADLIHTDIFHSDQEAVRYLYGRIRSLEMHELDEWFLYDGVRLFDPHKKGEK